MTLEYKVINKNLMVTRRNKSCSWQVEANIFEMVKAYCIWDAKESSTNYLPRFLPFIGEEIFPDLYQWRLCFSGQDFRGDDQRLAEELANVDFSKPFNEEVAMAVKNKFSVKAVKKTSVDADLIIMGELGELDKTDSKVINHE